MLVRRIVSSPLFFQSYKKPLFSFRSQPNVTFYWLVRSYTTEKAEKMKLTIATPSNVLIKNKLVDKIKIPGATGDFVLLPNHVSYISELRPGLIVVEDEKNQEKFFVSGGFVFFHKNSTCSVHAAECVPLQHLDLDLAQKVLTQWETQLKAATNEKDKAIARIAVETATEICRTLRSHK